MDECSTCTDLGSCVPVSKTSDSAMKLQCSIGPTPDSVFIEPPIKENRVNCQNSRCELSLKPQSSAMSPLGSFRELSMILNLDINGSGSIALLCTLLYLFPFIYHDCVFLFVLFFIYCLDYLKYCSLFLPHFCLIIFCIIINLSFSDVIIKFSYL